MFSRFARTPLRRCLHTSSSAARPQSDSFRRTAKYALGATAATAAILAWQLSHNQIALDAPRAMTSTTEHPTPAKAPQRADAPSKPTPPPASSSAPAPAPDAPSAPAPAAESAPAGDAPAPAGEGEGEAAPGGAPSSGGAFNPETGEINWDCPCLGGMAHGPCGPEFREAFSCFVFSEAEPKGINCVDKFQNMQNCFRAHPDVYADEIMDDNDDDDASPPSADASTDAPASDSSSTEFVPDAPSTPDAAQPVTSPVAKDS